MASSQQFSKKWRINLFVLFIILMCQLLSIIFLNVLINEFCKQAYLAFVKIIVLVIEMLAYIVVDLAFIYNKIVLLRFLASKEPIRCVIDDILLVKYKDGGRVRCTPHLIVRSTKTNKRYFTYGKFSLLGLSASVSYGRGQIIGCTIYKKGMISISIGDYVDIYVYKVLNLPVSVDEGKNIVMIKNDKLSFCHVNDKIHISMFNEIILFKGAIDVDCIKER